MEKTPGTMSERGPDFVAAWPKAITRRLDLSAEWMATAMRRAALITPDEEDELRQAFLSGRAADQVAALTPGQAQAAIEQLKAISRELAEEAKTSCHYCGLPLQDGACPEGCQ